MSECPPERARSVQRTTHNKSYVMLSKECEEAQVQKSEKSDQESERKGEVRGRATSEWWSKEEREDDHKSARLEVKVQPSRAREGAVLWTVPKQSVACIPFLCGTITSYTIKIGSVQMTGLFARA